jgi:hypothetical protein
VTHSRSALQPNAFIPQGIQMTTRLKADLF